MYYDVCEDPEELQSMVHTGIQQGNLPAVGQLKRRLQTLETKRGNICARRAYLRNKKVWASATASDLFYSASCPDDLWHCKFCGRTNVLICEKDWK